MSKYCIKFRPLEVYTLGTEQSSEYSGVNATGKESYIETSGIIPDQTTLFGTLRYLVLKKRGLLNSGFNYSQEEAEKINNLIGSESFKFKTGENGKQNFGCIKEMSPMFIVGDDGDILVKNPFCNTLTQKQKSGRGKLYPYNPIRMGEKMITSHGTIRLPLDFNAKQCYGSGFMVINSDGVLQDVTDTNDIFKKHIRTGNQSNASGERGEKAFFKREVVEMNPEYSFAVIADIADNVFDDKEQMTANIGRKGSTFMVQIEKLAEDSNLYGGIEKYVEAAFTAYVERHEVKDVWYYALSDIYCPEDIINSDSNGYAMILKKYIRNIETVLSENGYHKKRKKNERINLIEKGSVFFFDPCSIQSDAYKNCKKAGYNAVIILGGNE